MECDSCDELKDDICFRQEEDNSFGLIGGKLDWLVVVPKDPKEFTHQILCHDCIHKFIFVDQTMLIDRSYYDRFDYSWVNGFQFRYITLEAVEKFRQFQESKIKKFHDLNQQVKSQDLSDYYTARELINRRE